MKAQVFVLGMIGVTALILTGCQRQKRADVVVGGHVLTVSARLVCPERQGAFRRTAEAADGQTCDYVGPQDEGVQLKRLSLNGASAADRLGGLRGELSALVPLPAPSGGDRIAISKSSDGGDEDRADINLPGLSVKADGDKATVNLPGIHINAEGDAAHISTKIGALKNAKIDANEDGAQVAADMTDAANVDMTWFVVGKAAGPNGDHMAGYYARGPKTGPLVVALIRSKTRHQQGAPFNLLGGDDVHKLVGLSLK
jgi:hypothetical protein